MKIVIRVVILLTFLPCIVFAGVLDEFNGIRWKSKFPRQGYKLIRKSDEVKLRFYARANSNTLYGIPVQKVVYTVDKGVFNSAYADLDESSYKLVRQYLITNYGQPVNMAGREVFSVSGNGRKAGAILQPGLVNFSYRD